MRGDQADPILSAVLTSPTNYVVAGESPPLSFMPLGSPFRVLPRVRHLVIVASSLVIAVAKPVADAAFAALLTSTPMSLSLTCRPLQGSPIHQAEDAAVVAAVTIAPWFPRVAADVATTLGPLPRQLPTWHTKTKP